MLTTDILSLPASRELDALVAEKVMGWTLLPCPVHQPRECSFGGQAPGEREPAHIPPYSTSIAAAWEVVEHIKHDVSMYVNHTDAKKPTICVVIAEPKPYNGMMLPCGEADTAPLAICRAALKAVGC